MANYAYGDMREPPGGDEGGDMGPEPSNKARKAKSKHEYYKGVKTPMN